jgi:hypothetical protein
VSDLTDEELVASFLEAVRGLSGREVGRTVPGVTQSDFSRWSRGQFEALTAAKRRALIRFVDGRKGAPKPAVLFTPVIDYAGLGIDLNGLEHLTPEARTDFDRLMLNLIAVGCDRVALERAGRTLLAPIVEGAITTEEDQLATLQALKAVARRMAAEALPIVPGAAETGADRMLQDLRDAGQLPGADEHPGGEERRRTPA